MVIVRNGVSLGFRLALGKGEFGVWSLIGWLAGRTDTQRYTHTHTHTHTQGERVSDRIMGVTVTVYIYTRTFIYTYMHAYMHTSGFAGLLLRKWWCGEGGLREFRIQNSEEGVT
ncbi:hypothetical protein F5X97DRAFT_125427 [Nemania serpens]|nr:hypothetical protein F5X97DRAFT_125427 [Nemania serpens]